MDNVNPSLDSLSCAAIRITTVSAPMEAHYPTQDALMQESSYGDTGRECAQGARESTNKCSG